MDLEETLQELKDRVAFLHKMANDMTYSRDDLIFEIQKITKDLDEKIESSVLDGSRNE